VKRRDFITLIGGVIALISFRLTWDGCSSLLPFGGVLFFQSEAREASGSETARFHHAARRSGSVATRSARASLSIADDHHGGTVRCRRINRRDRPHSCRGIAQRARSADRCGKRRRRRRHDRRQPRGKGGVLNTRKDFPANNLPEFIDYVRKDSAKLQFGSAGPGTTTHLGCALLNAVIGVNVTHVPYRGGGPAANDLIGGQIDYMCLNMGGAAPLIVGKQIKAVATLSRSRSPLMPDLPTAHEQGLIDFDVVTWNAFFLPKGAPLEIVKKLNAATSQAMDTPAITNRMHELGITGVALERRSPEYLATFVVDEIARWAGPIKANGLEVD